MFNGLELDGDGMKVPGQRDIGVSNHFCPTCGSAVFWHTDAQPGLTMMAVGCFLDPDFPAPTIDLFTSMRYSWIGDLAGAQSFERFPESI